MTHTEDKEIKLIVTDDGSHSLFVPALNETYHSFHGAVQESRHVFIKMGLDYQMTNNPKPHYEVFEVGLGTGLNALLTAEFAAVQKLSLHMTSIEAYPLPWEVIKKLNYTQFIQDDNSDSWLEKIHGNPWETNECIHDNFTLKKVKVKLEDFQPEHETFDIIYFDAFAPNRQEELWSLSMLKKVTGLMNRKGVFVTYCAKGQLKRDLASLGLQVNTLPGPPGKKEMVQAIKL